MGYEESKKKISAKWAQLEKEKRDRLKIRNLFNLIRKKEIFLEKNWRKISEKKGKALGREIWNLKNFDLGKDNYFKMRRGEEMKLKPTKAGRTKKSFSEDVKRGGKIIFEKGKDVIEYIMDIPYRRKKAFETGGTTLTGGAEYFKEKEAEKKRKKSTFVKGY